MDLIPRLRQLGEDGATGRLDVSGSPGGRIYFDLGAVGCAEQHGSQTLLLAMAEADLFTPPEWAAALKVPAEERWRALAGRDDGRLQQLDAFAAEFTKQQLQRIVTGSAASAAFVDGARHSMGTLASWTVDELLGPDRRPAPIDRAEFLELLAEISPHVR